VLPDYGGACISSVVPALLHGKRVDWMPEAASAASQIVLLVLDGLGWEQLLERASLAPTLTAMAGGPITSVAPSTTATALTSIVTGLPPAAHGVMGYRIAVGHGEVLNVLRWSTERGDARQTVPPEDFQAGTAFEGTCPPVITKSHFGSTGFTAAHLAGTRLVGWRVPSSIPVEIRRLVADGEPFVYAYYDGIDHVAHAYGFGPHYDAELRHVDRLVADVVAGLPAGAVLVVTADHGQVQTGNAVLTIDEGVMADVEMLSGEARFRWMHARAGARRRRLGALPAGARGRRVVRRDAACRLRRAGRRRRPGAVRRCGLRRPGRHGRDGAGVQARLADVGRGTRAVVGGGRVNGEVWGPCRAAKRRTSRRAW
jgi:hypothetical protein